MAKLLTRKIYKFHTHNIKSFSNRMELIPHSSRLSATVNEDIPCEESGGQTIRYNVCREREGSRKFVFEKKPRLSEESAHEQLMSEENETHHVVQQPTTTSHYGYRTFDVSTTQKNIILPLKQSKLAKPFPDPVKMMRSHTVSDQDKAEQAQAEFRVPRSITRKAVI